MGNKLTLRSCIEAEVGYVLIAIDASQIELRVVGMLSQDPLLLHALQTEDLHLATAIQVFGQTDDADEMARRRKIAKTINFAILYGATKYHIADMLSIEVDEAEELISSYFSKYCVLSAWMKESKKEARKNGYVTTFFGRKRYLPDLNSRDYKKREEAEKQVINTIVQGTAVDNFKLMMLWMRNKLPRTVKLVLQVHDEMVWELPVDYVNQFMAVYEEFKINFSDFPCKLTIGKNYSNLVKIEEYYDGNIKEGKRNSQDTVEVQQIAS